MRPGLRSFCRNSLIGAAIVGCAAAYLSLDAYAKDHAFLINRSPSLPNWAYFLKREKRPERGEIAFFAPPKNALIVQHFGPSPALFGKIVYGVPGDQVVHRGAHVIVIRSGGTEETVASLKPRARTGERLIPGPTGLIPSGCYYMGSPHPDGFDSRYAAVGFICRERIVGISEWSLL